MEETARQDWDALLESSAKKTLEASIAERIVNRRWFGGKSRRIAALSIIDSVPISAAFSIALARIQFAEGPEETYQLPLGLAGGADAARVAESAAWTRFDGEQSVIYDAASDPAFARVLLDLFDSQQPCVAQQVS